MICMGGAIERLHIFTKQVTQLTKLSLDCFLQTQPRESSAESASYNPLHACVLEGLKLIFTLFANRVQVNSLDNQNQTIAFLRIQAFVINYCTSAVHHNQFFIEGLTRERYNQIFFICIII